MLWRLHLSYGGFLYLTEAASIFWRLDRLRKKSLPPGSTYFLGNKYSLGKKVSPYLVALLIRIKLVYRKGLQESLVEQTVTAQTSNQNRLIFSLWTAFECFSKQFNCNVSASYISLKPHSPNWQQHPFDFLSVYTTATSGIVGTLH